MKVVLAYEHWHPMRESGDHTSRNAKLWCSVSHQYTVAHEVCDSHMARSWGLLELSKVSAHHPGSLHQPQSKKCKISYI